MNRNSNTRFSMNPPSLDMSRSVFSRPMNHKTTFNAGKLIPIYCEEILPGDTVTLDTSMLVRMATPIYPVMDNAFLDLYYFFVPNRLVWDHWKQFNGENDVNAWVPSVDYTVPSLITEESMDLIETGDLGDYFGLPVNTFFIDGINALPFRGYHLIWNEWFRDQNLQDPILVDRGDSARYFSEDKYKKLLPVAKIHDYFTSALPAPQKGQAVTFGVSGGDLPVVAKSSIAYGPDGQIDYTTSNEYTHNLRWAFGDADAFIGTTGNSISQLYAGTPNRDGVNSHTGWTTIGVGDIATPNDPDAYTHVVPANLWAVNSSLSFTINALRQAFQVQKLLERDARGGTRYWEVLKSHFQVTAPDASLQRPEYLGGKRVPINMSQVLQTSATDSTSPQGNTAAYSKTTDYSNSFTKSFVEHGFLFGLVCVRTDHTYQQGINKMWSRKTRFDYYWPSFANIGEQAILNQEIYANGELEDKEVFGYQEAWAEYRYSPNRLSAAFRSNAGNGSLDSWHYGDYYDSRPYLSDEWIRETDSNIERTLAVSTELSDQFIADFYFNSKWTRAMPVYSVPGLIDHH